MRQQRMIELDLMKFWGILLVVLGHVTNMYTPHGLIHPMIQSDSLAMVSTFVYSFHMPLFVFVSGCVYAFQMEVLQRKVSFVSLLQKKSRRLLIPYLVFGMLLIVLMIGCGFRDNMIDYVYNGVLLSKDSRHLWFVLMLFEVFVLFRVMSKVVEWFKLPKWPMLVISFACYLLADRFPYIFQISSTFRYLFWFTLGYEFMLYKDIVNTVYVYISGGVVLILNMLATDSLGIRMPLIATLTAFVGIMVFYQISCDTKKVTEFKYYQIISKDSFGIYLYHVFFIYLLFYFLSDTPISPYLLCPLVFAVSLALSVVMTELTRKFGFHIIIGEKKPHAE